ncbi:MAG: YncE family protein [Thermoplasmata archaeon]|nr:YncE family protein [Thermoplasmata archaeon]
MKRIQGHSVVVWVIVLLAVSSAAMVGLATHAASSPISLRVGPTTAPAPADRHSSEAPGGTVLPAPTGRPGSGASGSTPLSPRTRAGPATSGWAVTNTLVIYNNTSVSGNYDPPYNGAQTDVIAMAFDNLSGEVFALSDAGVVSQISDTTNEVIHTFYPTPLGTPAGIVFDYKDNEMFILYSVSLSTSYVAVVSASTTSLLATVAVQDGSKGIAYDSGLGEVFVSNTQSENVSVISTATNAVVATVYLPLGAPEALVYDSGQHEVFAINDQYDLYHSNVTVISDVTNTVVATVAVPYGAISLGYDRGKGEVFVGSDTYGAGGTCNVTVVNDTTDTIVATIDVGIDPTGILYVPSLDELYVTNTGSLNVSVISDATNAVVDTVTLAYNPNVPVYEGPSYPVYDPGQAEVWFYGGFPGYVTGISTSTHHLTPTAWLTFDSRYFAYDGANQEEFLVDSTSGYVAVVSDVTGQVVAQIPVGGGAFQAAYDSGKGEVWVTNNGGLGNITVINATTNTVVAVFYIPGVGPTGIAYDPALGEMFVGNENCAPCSNITVINDTTYNVVGVIPYVGFVPFDLAYDSGKGEIFAGNIGGNVSVIDAATDTVVASVGTGVFGGWGMAYDSAKGEIFLTNVNGNNVTVISDATNKVVANISSLPGAWGAAYDPAAGEVLIGGDEGSTLSVISDVTNTVVYSITPDGEAPSAVAYDAETGDLYTADQAFGTLQTISPTGGTGPTHYPVTFLETGLPVGTPWSVTFNGTLGSSTITSIGYSVLDGSYTFTTGTVAGYTANVTGGPVTVSGAAVEVEIGFSSTGVPTYTVTFDESGLASPPAWTVTLGGSPESATTSTIPFVEVDGTYSFTVGVVTGYTASPSSGMVTVNGASLTRDIIFTPTTSPSTYPITFTETGLGSGTSWSVTLAGTLLPSSTSVIATSAVNGSYPYTVSAVVGYTVSPASGTVSITGAGQAVAITFTASPPGTSPTPSPAGFLGLPGSDGYILLGIILAAIVALLLLVLARRPNYPIVFTETGLPASTRWSVRLKDVTEFSDTETVRFSRPSGTYEFEVAPSTGRTPSPVTGYVVVEREQQIIAIRFGPP